MDVTVIIPAYNAEKRIERCINSVLTHLPKASLIIINDGSIDNTKKLLEHHYSEYENIKIIHKSNGGVSSARNVGLENVKTKYITFLDSDDEFNEGIEIFINESFKNKADLTIGGFKRISKKESLSIPICRYFGIKDYLINMNAREDFIHLQYSVAKIYSKEIINKNDIRFNEEGTDQ